ncbi:hypothetical protein GCM10011487_31100 [Steroidobacter agaridevorans]|uniref:Uncharacterized protein n=1 Tax=Steroidobacter agaridevorans TaxID=2695856 RepID=A0A829YCW1_9GAMM|nr:hypothetical protein [Steroidobacter agaridevorans]GFE81110.1 hypothetical protein GCM10011487_31100 [Steroidobacter agaridevorans]
MIKLASANLASVALLLISTATPAAPDYIPAVWRQQSLEFAYQGTATAYSCNTLQRRLEAILRSVGARDGISIVMQRCTDQADAYMQIKLESPVEATEANIAAVTQHTRTDELVAKVRHEALATPENIERFHAEWKTVSMARDTTLKLDSGDCELVKQLRRDVFPRMSIRVVHDNLRCSVAFGNLGQPQLSVAALVPSPLAP